MSRFHNNSSFDTYAAPAMLAGISAFVLYATGAMLFGEQDAMTNSSAWLAKAPVTAPARVQVAHKADVNQYARAEHAGISTSKVA